MGKMFGERFIPFIFLVNQTPLKRRARYCVFDTGIKHLTFLNSDTTFVVMGKKTEIPDSIPDYVVAILKY